MANLESICSSLSSNRIDTIFYLNSTRMNDVNTVFNKFRSNFIVSGLQENHGTAKLHTPVVSHLLKIANTHLLLLDQDSNPALDFFSTLNYLDSEIL